MGVTGQERRPGGDRCQEGEEQRPRRVMPFDVFLKMRCIDARIRNDAKWLEWYDGWLKGMPEDGREDYIERSRIDYERRTGMSIGEYVDRERREHTKANIAASLAERTKANAAETLAEITKANAAETLAEITKANIEEARREQIMVGNFEIFKREYMGMMGRRSC